MLFNFCDPRLRPEIECSTVSTEGHEVSNLISDSDKGFLAYACIKPPVNIDISFLCNVSINHILIWPHVGSQKSSGFQLYAKTSNDSSVPYTLLATGFLGHSNAGLLFSFSNNNYEAISVPPNFLKQHIKPSLRYLATYLSNLRVCICKTENSVPALGKIEVWGTVSPRCGKDTVASICSLWCKQQSFKSEFADTLQSSVEKPKQIDQPLPVTNNKEVLESSLQIPESFLDAITWEIMTQPILLPSGKIIDQSTLQKHEESEALWGRRLSDPFTGIPFSEDRKPIIAAALKMRIDKFLLENSNADEIKKLPRVLGHALPLSMIDKQISDAPKYLLKQNRLNKNISKPMLHTSVTSFQENKKFCHKLPVILMPRKRNASTLTQPVKKKRSTNSHVSLPIEGENEKKNDSCTDVVNLKVDNSVKFDVATVVPHLKRFNNIPENHDKSSMLNTCTCCPNGIFYQLPCKHVLCRKALTSIEDKRCSLCRVSYKNGEIKRIYQ
ncbi:RING finger protein 37 [Hylaeus volcanicus]|uniref:RING finger protein 37 n=1 Tax=Hylaeus volcanicus TaxID=313075 RepID=UPI0023B873C3|nr:RING finger protein 37 [Hylaeus volcanicus]